MGKMRNSVTMGYHCAPTRRSKLCVVGDVKHQQLSYTATLVAFRDLPVYLLTVNICISYDSTVPLLGIYSPPKYIHMNQTMFRGALFVEAKMCRLGMGISTQCTIRGKCGLLLHKKTKINSTTNY